MGLPTRVERNYVAQATREIVMKKWLVALPSTLAIVGCSKNTAGLSVEGESQRVLFADNVLGNRLVIDDISTIEVDGHARRGSFSQQPQRRPAYSVPILLV